MTETTLPFQHYLDALHEKYAACADGIVATYIPELAKADPQAFGICVVTADGYAYGGRRLRPPFHDAVDFKAGGVRSGAC